MTDHPPLKGCGQGYVTKFCMQVKYIKCLTFDDRLLPNGRGQSRDPCLNFAEIISWDQ